MQIAKFIREVKSEGVKKTTWPTKKEALYASITVVVSVLIAMLFFLLVDSVLFFAVHKTLGI